jgi:hypothetical protein
LIYLIEARFEGVTATVCSTIAVPTLTVHERYSNERGQVEAKIEYKVCYDEHQMFLPTASCSLPTYRDTGTLFERWSRLKKASASGLKPYKGWTKPLDDEWEAVLPCEAAGK